MKIELTEKQYRRLVELVFLGNWMVNSSALNGEENKDYSDLEQFIFSYSKELKMEDLIIFDETYKEYFPTRQFEELIDPYIRNYEEISFWEELQSRLARRDLLREIGPINKLDDSHIERQFKIEEKYENEFVKNGLKNLEVQSKKK